MKLVSRIMFIALCFISIFSHAATPDKSELTRFVKAIGIYEQIEEQKLAMKGHASQAAQQFAQQITATNPHLPEQFNQDMESALDNYFMKVDSLIDTEFAVNSYVELITTKLSAEEIQDLTAFYESDLGKKFTSSNTEVMGDWTNSFMGDIDKKLMVHLQALAKNLSEKASEYKQN